MKIAIGLLMFVLALAAFAWQDAHTVQTLSCSNGFTVQARRIARTANGYTWDREVKGRTHSLRYTPGPGELCAVSQVEEQE